jgi:stage V sporulation protein SpoVS
VFAKLAGGLAGLKVKQRLAEVEKLGREILRGIIDEVAVFRQALSEQEILRIASACPEIDWAP